MSISVTCRCGKRFRAKEEHAGRRARCRFCGHVVTVPGDPKAGYDVLVSYAPDDKITADAVCAGLESRKLPCWIAPRNVKPRADRDEALLEAMNPCRAMVLVFSSGANDSQEVRREVEQALTRGLILVAFGIEAVPMSGAMKGLLSGCYWLDATAPPVEQHVQTLSSTLKTLLAPEPERIEDEPAGPEDDQEQTPDEAAPPPIAPTAAPLAPQAPADAVSFPIPAADQPEASCTYCGGPVPPATGTGYRYCLACGQLWADPARSAQRMEGEHPTCPTCGHTGSPNVVAGLEYCARCGVRV